MSFLPLDASKLAIDQSVTDALIEVVNQQIMLHTFEDESLLDRMVEHLADERDRAQMQLIDTFGEIGDLATPILVKALNKHPNSRVRSAVARSLAKIADPEAVEDLVLALIGDQDTEVRAAAAAALSRMEEAAVPGLVSVLASPTCDEVQKGQAAWALSQVGEAGLIALMPSLQHPGVDVRCAVLRSIAKTAQGQPNLVVLSCLETALKDEFSPVRAEAIRALADLNQQQSIGAIALSLRDQDPDVRQAAVIALGRLRNVEALPSLRIALQDSVVGIRSLAKLSIQQIQGTL
ncbi:MAG: HEAT repeat domain-containing protein [Alkalinema sp. RU_4_3]|nr:HEAT repeat domain-containing protein [Alkalinema sp. RU_4_3]